MKDMIERQAAIEAIEWGITYAKAINKNTSEVTQLFQESNNELLKAAKRVKALPSAQPDEEEYRKCGEWDMFELITSAWYGKGNWIPVSELPKFVKTVDEGLEEENQVSDIVLVTNGKEVGPSELVKYWDEDEPFWVDPWFYDWPIDVHMDANEIIAWMPLLEPFKGGDPE